MLYLHVQRVAAVVGAVQLINISYSCVVEACQAVYRHTVLYHTYCNSLCGSCISS
jgi:hypothetical protein